MKTNIENRIQSQEQPSISRILTRNIICVAASALALALAATLVGIDAVVLENGVSEGSLTETTQEWLLMFATLGALRRAWHDKSQRGFALLLAGLFGAMFFRELDGFLDDFVYHGSWKFFVAPWLVLCVVLALRYGKTIFSGAADFVRGRPYIVITIGLLIVLVFSRILGHKSIWLALQDDPPLRTVKNAVEEGIELLGYFLIAGGMAPYGWRSRFTDKP